VCCLQLCALYAVTDVALVTSLRDGMNLVSYEYVACQSENAGAVELAERRSHCQCAWSCRLQQHLHSVPDLQRSHRLLGVVLEAFGGATHCAQQAALELGRQLSLAFEDSGSAQPLEPSGFPVSVPGVLVLSEFAGAAQSLGAGAILVNPWNITDMAAAIEDALTMSEQVLPAVTNPFPKHKTLQQHCRISRNGVGSL
jgi:Glycosyltransferase family 20